MLLSQLADLFKEVPFALPAPPDAVVIDEGERRFVSGPFDATPAMLISPSCIIAAQGEVRPGAYAHPARTLVPIRPVESLIESGAITGPNLGHLRADRLRSYFYLPEGPEWPESAALLYIPISMHHDVIAANRVAQLTGTAYWHLRVKLVVFSTGLLLDPSVFGPVPEPHDRTD
jgi:hypothetical protein